MIKLTLTGLLSTTIGLLIKLPSQNMHLFVFIDSADPWLVDLTITLTIVA